MDKVSFEQGVFCSKSWLSAPIGNARIPAGNKIVCCQAGDYLRCDCPNLSDEQKKLNTTPASYGKSAYSGCCPTTGYSVKRFTNFHTKEGKWLKVKAQMDEYIAAKGAAYSASNIAPNPEGQNYGTVVDGVGGKTYRYNIRQNADWTASASDCRACLPGTFTDDLNLQRACTDCPKGWYQDEGGKPFCLPCERKNIFSSCVFFPLLWNYIYCLRLIFL